MERIQAAKCAMGSGFPVRLCFDPMIYCKDWRGEYSRLVDDEMCIRDRVRGMNSCGIQHVI